MFRNHLKVAFRNLWKEKVYSLVNIVGLAVGIACFLLFALFVRHEWSFDRFHPDVDRIFRAWGREDWGEGRTFFYTVTPVPLAEALEDHLPEVEETVRVRPLQVLAGPPGRQFAEEVRIVDAAFFDVFGFTLVEGSRDHLFVDPNSVIVTPDAARRHFEGGQVLGETLLLDVAGRTEEYIVRGIVETPPVESSIQFDMLMPFSKAPEMLGANAMTNWFNISVETYLKLREGARLGDAEAKLPEMVSAILGDEARRSGYTLGLQPMTDIHLNTEYPVGIEPVSDPVYSFFLMGIAGLVLVIACINFVTLAVGQSARRRGEVGVRKALGAGRIQLARQFWGEAVLVVAISVAVGWVLARLALPFFNSLSGRILSLALDLPSAGVLAAAVLMVATLSGLYPAWVISSFRPIEALRGRPDLAGDRSTLRKLLVVVQFSISIVLIVGTLFAIRQLDFLRRADLGFQEDHVVVVRTGRDTPDAAQIADRMRTALAGRAAVRSIASSAFPMNDGWARFGFDTDDGSYAEVMGNLISPEFLPTLGIDVVAGRGFSSDRTGDSTALVVNEAFVREYGFTSPDEAIGKRLPSSAFADHEIVGVVGDFNYESLHSHVRPLVLVVTADWLFDGADDVNVPSSMSPELSIRIGSDDVSGTIDLLESTWSEVGGGRPFEFYFLDEALDNRYRQEERVSRIVFAGSALAIVIACMGLFGLAALTVVRRRKEIGVRKVLGATVSNIVLILARDFILLVAASFLLAVPAGYLLVSSWLESFAFRVPMTAWTFVAGGLVALFFALAAVSYQSVRAAQTDPVRSLRYE